MQDPVKLLAGLLRENRWLFQKYTQNRPVKLFAGLLYERLLIFRNTYRIKLTKFGLMKQNGSQLSEAPVKY